MFEMHLAKEAHKFSCGHLMILGPDRAETLHGHNYYVGVDVLVKDLDPSLGMAFDHGELKPLIKAFCAGLDERVLLPAHSPYLEIRHETDQYHVRFGKKHYAFPAEDVVLLPIANLTCEELARMGALHLAERMHTFPRWTGLRVTIEETKGQSVSYLHTR